jgi:hypothetical protein
MAPQTNRKEILERLRAQIASGKPIVGAGAGIGLSAKFIEAGGGDLIIIYNSGRFRMAGRGSLAGLMPYGNANDVVLEMVSTSSFLLLFLAKVHRLRRSSPSSSTPPSLPASAQQTPSAACPHSSASSKISASPVYRTSRLWA